MVLERPIQAGRRRWKRRQRVCGDGTGGARSLRGAHAGNEVIDEGTTILAELAATAGRTDIRLAI